jgi:hypothetical protein
LASDHDLSTVEELSGAVHDVIRDDELRGAEIGELLADVRAQPTETKDCDGHVLDTALALGSEESNLAVAAPLGIVVSGTYDR